jgi:hypothetical protein
MRTTVTLEPDTEDAVRRLMRERGLTFKQAVNEAIRAGISRPKPRTVRFPTYRMGKPLIPLDKALQLAGELEDEELIRKMVTGR